MIKRQKPTASLPSFNHFVIIVILSRVFISFEAFLFFFFLKQDEHKLDSNKDIFYNKHKFEAIYMYLRQVSGRGHRTQ